MKSLSLTVEEIEIEKTVGPWPTGDFDEGAEGRLATQLDCRLWFGDDAGHIGASRRRARSAEGVRHGVEPPRCTSASPEAWWALAMPAPALMALPRKGRLGELPGGVDGRDAVHNATWRDPGGRIGYHAVRVSELAEIRQPPQRRGGRKAAGFWRAAEKKAMIWLAENGVPAEGDGEQARLERYIADELSKQRLYPSEPSVRRHVSAWIRTRRSELIREGSQGSF